MKKSDFKFERDKAWVTYVNVGFGVYIYVCFVPNTSMPLGMVWGEIIGSDTKKIFNTHHSYVLPFARRQGVRTRINEEILKFADVIVTGGGSKEGGLAFLKASGYKKNEVTGEWFLERVPSKRK